MNVRFFIGWLLWFAAGGALAGNPYSGHSDQELTNAAADWETLSDEQRRALLTEMRGRMDAKKGDASGPVVAIRTQRRYGRLVRQPDGSVVRVETTEQIVRYRQLPEASESADAAFGVGFEHRVIDQPAPDNGIEEEAVAEPGAPVLVEHAPR